MVKLVNFQLLKQSYVLKFYGESKSYNFPLHLEKGWRPQWIIDS